MTTPWTYARYGLVSAAALVAALAGQVAGETADPAEMPAGHAVVMPESAEAPQRPREAALLALVNTVWADASATWQAIFNALPKDRVVPQINVVPKVTASHCYGLYINSGPVYCSGNSTVFVSLQELDKLAQRFDAGANAALAFLMAHEFGHHIQMSAGRFRLLSQMIRKDPARRREYVMRLELEADCLAGVWAGRSQSFAATQRVKAELLQALALVGDDHVQVAASGPADPANFWHGTSEQRAHWFYTGQKAENPGACNVLTAAEF